MNTNYKEKSSDIGRTLQQQIRAGTIKMKPRLYFVLMGALYIVSAVVVFGTALYLVSFIVFILKANGILTLPYFGIRGFGILASSLPWLLIILIIILVIVLELLGKHFSFVYRWPLLYSMLGIVIFVLAFGIVAGHSPLHYAVLSQAQNRTLPFGGPLYRHYGTMHLRDAHIGTVLERATSTLVIQDRSGALYTIILSPERRYPLRGIEPDDIVMVIGSRTDGTIQAIGVREIKRDVIPIFRGPGRPSFIPVK